MSIRVGAVVALLTLAAAAAAAVPVPQPSEQALLVWTPGAPRCGDEALPGAVLIPPQPALTWARPSALQPAARYRFRIDATGRPLSIAKDGDDYRSGLDDIAPALAASHFAAGTARTDCKIAFAARMTSLQESAPADLAAYGIAPVNEPLPQDAWRRIHAGDCADAPRPAPLLRAFPDYRKIPGAPGVRQWTMIGFDQNAAGRPVNARAMFGTGSPALDAAAIKAVHASRFTGGARRGCFFTYWRTPETLPAPPTLGVATMRPVDSNCPVSEDGWAVAPKLIYPRPYWRRAIEGWAVVAFDVAPWGETGNLRVLASEPAAGFGEQAIQMLRAARKPASLTGRSGCVEVVRFVMAKGHADAESTVSD